MTNWPWGALSDNLIALCFYRVLSEGGAVCYKHLYPEGQEKTWGNQQGNRKKSGRKQDGEGSDGSKSSPIILGLPSDPSPSCFPGAPAVITPEFRRTPAGQASDWTIEHLLPLPNYCGIFADGPGWDRGSKGSRVLERPLSRRFRMRSTTRGSVIKDTMRMRPPQLHRRGSASKIFLIRRAHVLRASFEQSKSS